jgi:hypothetical protein
MASQQVQGPEFKHPPPPQNAYKTAQASKGMWIQKATKNLNIVTVQK